MLNSPAIWVRTGAMTTPTYTALKLRKPSKPRRRRRSPGFKPGRGRQTCEGISEGPDVVDVVGDGDVLVRRVIGGRGVARAESSGGNPKGAASRRQRSRAGEQRIHDRFGSVRASTGVHRCPRSHRVGGPA